MDEVIPSDDVRREILDVLDQLTQEHPGWRIGQPITNVAFLARQSDNAVWDVENEEFVQAARQHLRRIAGCNRASVQETNNC